MGLNAFLDSLWDVSSFQLGFQPISFKCSLLIFRAPVLKGRGVDLFEMFGADDVQSAVNRQWYEDYKVMLNIDFFQVRTVLNEKQLHMLRTCYAANPRPDALMKEQLVEMTGLSPRVIRVWFQNKRCKDKKKQIMIKQMEQHHQVRQKIFHFLHFFLIMEVLLDLNYMVHNEDPTINI